MFALIIPTLLSCLVLAAHFMRNDQLTLMVLSCAAPMLLLFRNKWATRALQAAMVLGALEWLRATLEIRAVRIDEGREWHRMAIILCSVAAFTAASAAAYLLPSLRRHYSPRA